MAVLDLFPNLSPDSAYDPEAKNSFRADAMRDEGLDPADKNDTASFNESQDREWEDRGVEKPEARDYGMFGENLTPESYAEDKDEK